jgi:DNA modification methylase
MSHAKYVVCDVFDGLASLPDDSVDLVLSSPPYLGLRSYLDDDSPLKEKEIGDEGSPAEFIDVMLDVVEACERVLAPHGTLCFCLGDTYAGSGGAGGDYNDGGLREGQNKFSGSARKRDRLGEGDGYRPTRNGRVGEWPLDKSICFVPSLFGASLAYGRNLLRPGRLVDPWRIRNFVVWCKPNPSPGRLGDKFRPGTEFLTIACKSADRWFDLDGVRRPPKHGLDPSKPMGNGLYRDHPNEGASTVRPDRVSHPAGAPPLDWWEISPEGYEGSHYATWPRKLLLDPIQAMCPHRICTACGEPSRHLVEGHYPDEIGGGTERDREGRGRKEERPTEGYRDLGWSDCGHDSWRRGVVLDPFAGSGTTLAVSTGLGRDAIGFDLDEDNVHLAVERVGPMFVEVERLART